MQVDDSDPLPVDGPGLAACYAAAASGISVTGERAGKPTLRLIVPEVAPTTPPDGAEVPVAEVRGVNVHARQRVDGRDRKQLERLCRYITRPPIAQDRLTRRTDGRLELELKKVWRDGTRALVFEPHDLLTRLVAAVPPPRLHLLRYFGVLSSHSSLRAKVVPHPLHHPAQCRPPPAPGDQLELYPTASEHHPPKRARWAWLLAHVFRADLETCTRCGGPMLWLEIATDRDAIARLLAKHGLAPRPPPPPRPTPLGQLELNFARTSDA
jgi:Putative transposase